MPQVCRVCAHPKRDEINRELMKAGASPSRLAERYGLNREGIRRHANTHLKVSAQAVSERKNALTIIGYANDLYDRATKVLKAAEAGLETLDEGGLTSPRSLQAAAASLREVRASIELLAKLVVTDEPTSETETRNAWIDDAIAAELATMAPPELPAGPPLASGVDEAEVVPD